MPLHVPAAEVPERHVVQTGERGVGEMTVRMAYGREASLMVATRQPGYHTKPHVHPAEQLNYVLEGELWIYVEDEAYHCKAGDFQRIAPNRVHWAWNRSDQPVLMAEVHSPPLVAGRDFEGAVSLFGADEAAPESIADNEFVEYDAAAVEAAHHGLAEPVR